MVNNLLRTKPGSGKTPWGLSPSTLARLEQIKADKRTPVVCGLKSLLFQSEIAVQHARDLCKCAQRDEARTWYRFFLNSAVPSLFATAFPSADLANFNNNLQLLGGECHPEDKSNYSTELENIRARLDELLSRIPCPGASGSDCGDDPTRNNAGGQPLRPVFGDGRANPECWVFGSNRNNFPEINAAVSGSV